MDDSMQVPSTFDVAQRLRAAIKLTMANGMFFDSKFFVFSRKRSSRSITTPLPVYANSHILKSSSAYFGRSKSI